MNKTPAFNAAARHKARRFALQALYQWHIAKHSVAEIAAQYAEERLMPKADVHYFNTLITEIPAQQPELDAHFITFLDRALTDLDPVELAILRIAAYEMAAHLEIPYRVVIDEAVELAKEFGAADSYKYINGVVHQMATQLRPAETST